MVNRSRSNSRDRLKSRKNKDREREKKKERRHGVKTNNRHSRTRSRSPRISRREKNSPSPPLRSSKKERNRSESPQVNNDYLTLGNVKPKLGNSKVHQDKPLILDPLAFEGKTQEEIEMLKIMGFDGFDTTKNKHVDGSCNAHAINIQQKRRYRQYMNRKGGFNRPLDPVA